MSPNYLKIPVHLISDAQLVDLHLSLSKICQRTLGIDYSKSFIDAANNLKDQRSMPYRFLVEGRLYADGLAQIDIGPGEVEFKVGDALRFTQ